MHAQTGPRCSDVELGQTEKRTLREKDIITKFYEFKVNCQTPVDVEVMGEA